MRVALLVEGLEHPDRSDTPGLVILAADGAVMGITPEGEAWLDELQVPGLPYLAVPIEVQAVAARLRASDSGALASPRLRGRTRAGRWAILHASWMDAAGTRVIAVVIEEAVAAELAPVIMLACGLTPQERVVTGVARGLSTAAIAAELHISRDTVGDHLKAVFHKTGVGSRTELVATIMRQQYLPRAKAGDPIGVDGFFA